jgi:TonB family protein
MAVQPVTAPPPAVVTAADSSSPAVFVMGAPVRAVEGSQGSVVATSSAASVSPDAPIDEDLVSSAARVIYQPVTSYPSEARAAAVEADVPVSIVVDRTGRVIQAHVQRHVGYGLDEVALDTVLQTRFSPAERDGHVVPVRMVWTMQFRLQ